jgi:GYF domain 2
MHSGDRASTRHIRCDFYAARIRWRRDLVSLNAAAESKMGIKFLCPNGHKLHVKAFLGGKKAICPECGARVIVPLEQPAQGRSQLAETPPEPARSERSAGEPLEATLVDDAIEAMTATAPALPLAGGNPAAGKAPPSMFDPIDEAPAAVWYVRPATGGQYGPASGQVMRSWLEQGRVGANSLVWRDGWNEWRSASDAFPELGSLAAPSAFAGAQSARAVNGMPPLPANLPLGHVVEGVPEVPPSVNLPPSMPPSMPPLAHAARKRRRRNDTRLIFSAILGVVSLILVIVLVLVFRAQTAPSEPQTQEPSTGGEESPN